VGGDPGGDGAAVTAPSFETRRVTLTPATVDDVDALWALWRDADVRRYLFDDVPVTRERALEAFTAATVLWLVRRGGADAIIGMAGLMPTLAAAYDETLRGTIEIVAAFEPRAWGHGYAAEALAPVIDYAFTGLGHARLIATADVPNVASQRLIERLGFTATGECAGPVYRQRTYVLTLDGFAMRS
jgi:[ribosomal protein S5]-alanine N-acetyltransferase